MLNTVVLQCASSDDVTAASCDKSMQTLHVLSAHFRLTVFAHVVLLQATKAVRRPGNEASAYILYDSEVVNA